MKKLIQRALLTFAILGGYINYSHAYTITHNDYTSGNSITAAGQNTNENAAFNVINGNLEGSSANSGGSAVNIKQGTISTPDFRANAVTNSTVTYTTTPATDSGTTVITTTTITTQGGTILVLGQVGAALSAINSNANIYLFKGANEVEVSGCSNGQSTSCGAAFSYLDQGQSAGTYSYSLRQKATVGSYSSTNSAYLIAIEIKD